MTEVPDLETLLEDSARLIEQVRELTERLAEKQNIVINTVKRSNDDRDGE